MELFVENSKRLKAVNYFNKNCNSITQALHINSIEICYKQFS